MEDIHNTYGTIFQSRGSGKPTCQRYRDFAKAWSWKKTLFEVADEKIEKVAEVNQIFLTTFLEFVCYLTDKGEAERAQDKFDEQRRKMKK